MCYKRDKLKTVEWYLFQGHKDGSISSNQPMYYTALTKEKIKVT